MYFMYPPHATHTENVRCGVYIAYRACPRAKASTTHSTRLERTPRRLFGQLFGALCFFFICYFGVILEWFELTGCLDRTHSHTGRCFISKSYHFEIIEKTARRIPYERSANMIRSSGCVCVKLLSGLNEHDVNDCAKRRRNLRVL